MLACGSLVATQTEEEKWTSVKQGICSKHRTPRVYEQKARPHQRDFRQFFITDLGPSCSPTTALHRGEGRRLRPGVVMRRQALALLGIEHGVALQEGNFPLGHLALGVGLGAGDAVGIDHKFAGLALADMAAEFDGLISPAGSTPRWWPRDRGGSCFSGNLAGRDRRRRAG
jgi:hypothetical protein